MMRLRLFLSSLLLLIGPFLCPSAHGQDFVGDSYFQENNIKLNDAWYEWGKMDSLYRVTQHYVEKKYGQRSWPNSLLYLQAARGAYGDYAHDRIKGDAYLAAIQSVDSLRQLIYQSKTKRYPEVEIEMTSIENMYALFYDEKKEYKEARQFYHRALKRLDFCESDLLSKKKYVNDQNLRKKLIRQKVKFLINLADNYSLDYEPDKGVAYMDTVLFLSEKYELPVEDRVSAYNSQGAMHIYKMPQPELAETYLLKAMTLAELNPGKVEEQTRATVYYNLGCLYFQIGKLDKAFAILTKALQSKLPKSKELIAFQITVLIYIKQQQAEKAYELLTPFLASKEIKNKEKYLDNYLKLEILKAECLQLMGRWEQAREALLKIIADSNNQRSPAILRAYFLLADDAKLRQEPDIYQSLNKLKINFQTYEDQNSTGYFNDLAAFFIDVLDVSTSEKMLGHALRANHVTPDERFSAKIFEEVQSKEDLYKSIYLWNLNKLISCKKNPESWAVLKEVKNNLYLLDTLASLIQDDQFVVDNSILYTDNNRRQFLTQQSLEIFEILYKASGDANYLKEAFYFLEKSKGRILRQKFTAKALLRSLRIETKLAEEERIRSSINYYRRTIKQMEKDASSKERRLELEEKLLSLFEQQEKIRTFYQLKHPRYFRELRQEKVVQLETIQATLKTDEALLMYFFLDPLYSLMDFPDLYVFYIAKDQMKLVPIKAQPDQDEISNINELASLLNEKLSSSDFLSASKYGALAYPLYQALLEPLAPLLRGKKRLIIVPDDQIFQIPLEALVKNKPAENVDYEDLEFVLGDYQIEYRYAARIWNEAAQEPQNKNWEYQFTGFAPFAEGEALARDQLASRDRKKLDPLPASRFEVNGIYNQFTEKDNTAAAFISGAAQKKNFLDLTRNSRILHIASHSVYDASNEENYIVFAPGDSIINHSQRLYMQEVYALPLGADLVTLSSCGSADGKVVDGEGVFSLAYAFIYSGVPKTLVSLWSVDDEETKELMLAFYEQVLAQEGKDYRTALHLAKVNLLKERPWLSPRYWSPFILIGN